MSLIFFFFYRITVLKKSFDKSFQCWAPLIVKKSPLYTVQIIHAAFYYNRLAVNILIKRREFEFSIYMYTILFIVWSYVD